MKNILELLYKGFADDHSSEAILIHGSFVTESTSKHNFKEYKFIKDDKFIFSYFELKKINPDIDLLYVSNDVLKSKEIISKFFKDLKISGYFITINLIDKETFEQNIRTKEPTAVKRILLFKEIAIIKGKEYLDKVKDIAKDFQTSDDRKFQLSYDKRKAYLRLFAKKKKNFVLDSFHYKKLFTKYYNFMTGLVKGGFPENRFKLVYPYDMHLKAEININNCNINEER